MEKKVYEPPALRIARVDMEQSIAQVVISGKIVLDAWEEGPVIGENPETEGGDFYVFY